MNGEATILRTGGIRTLYHSGEFWMSDAKIHDRSMKELSDQASGDVLVGGYGMGLIQRHLINNDRVTSVTTVEINVDVIRAMLCEDGWIWGDVIIADFNCFESDRRWDCVIGDTWADAPTDDNPLYTGFLKVAPSLIKPGGKILTWEGSW